MANLKIISESVLPGIVVVGGTKTYKINPNWIKKKTGDNVKIMARTIVLVAGCPLKLANGLLKNYPSCSILLRWPKR